MQLGAMMGGGDVRRGNNHCDIVLKTDEIRNG